MMPEGILFLPLAKLNDCRHKENQNNINTQLPDAISLCIWDEYLI